MLDYNRLHKLEMEGQDTGDIYKELINDIVEQIQDRLETYDWKTIGYWANDNNIKPVRAEKKMKEQYGEINEW